LDGAPAPFDMEIRLGALERPLRWDVIFGNANPVHIEIGSGSGHWLAEFARLHPEWNFLGIEKTRSEVRRALDKIQRRGLVNVRLISCYADYVIALYVGDASVDALHVYFPDPWPKTRHARRRVFQPDFVRELARILKPGAPLFAMTDVDDYHRRILTAAAQVPSLRLEEDRRLDLEYPRDAEGRPVPFDLIPAAELPEAFRLTTNYERKALAAGSPIHSMRWRRLDAGESLPAQ